MLVLSRKPQETIVVGEDVKISVLTVSGKQVRIGIEAPKNVAVNREEIHKRIQASQGQADVQADVIESSDT